MVDYQMIKCFGDTFSSFVTDRTGYRSCMQCVSANERSTTDIKNPMYAKHHHHHHHHHCPEAPAAVDLCPRLVFTYQT